MSVVGIASHMTRIIGIFTIAVVAVIPLMSLANDASSFLKPDGMRLISTPQFIQILVFGMTSAATGDMIASCAFSFVFMYALRHFFTKNGGSYASQYIKGSVVKSVQKNVFSYEQPTSS
tara:strand:+ start:422 stop:778 length:357 start_codon:yes stop_codon:yes gene_type:complete